MSKDDPVISVIIPIYNVEKYLDECVSNVLNQTFQDIEIVLVDDGSRDTSGVIADDFASKDARVIVIHQENQGLSAARNTGLRRARGEYVIFLDSDDFWGEPDGLRQFVEQLQAKPEVDILFFDSMRYHDDTGQRAFRNIEWDLSRMSGRSEVELLRHSVAVSDLRPSAWDKVIRRWFLLDNGLFFTPGLLSEDIEWFLRLLTHPFHFDYVPTRFHMYRQDRPGSITNTVGRRYVETQLNTVLTASRNILMTNQTDDFLEDYLSYCCYQFTIALSSFGGLSRDERRSLRSLVDEASSLLAHDRYGRSREISRLSKVMGVENTGRVLYGYLWARSAVRASVRRIVRLRGPK